jgi:hypothetical protein
VEPCGGGTLGEVSEAADGRLAFTVTPTPQTGGRELEQLLSDRLRCQLRSRRYALRTAYVAVGISRYNVRSGRASARFTRDVLTRRGPRRSCSHRRTARPLSTGCSSPAPVRPSERRELARPSRRASGTGPGGGRGSSAKTPAWQRYTQPSMRSQQSSAKPTNASLGAETVAADTSGVLAKYVA